MNLDLVRMFSEWNLKSFHGKLPVPEIRWNSRLKSSAGRFIPGAKRSIIEIAGYLTQEENAEALIRDTMGHEMIHLRQARLGNSGNHNALFARLARRVCAAHGFDPKSF